MIRNHILFSVIASIAAPFIVAASYAPQVAIPLTILVNKKSDVSSDRIYLEDLATCKGHASVCNDVNAIDLGRSSLNRQPVQIPCHEIREFIDLEIKGHAIDLNCTGSVTVYTNLKSVDIAALQEQLSRSVAAIDKPVAIRHLVKISSIAPIEIPIYATTPNFDGVSQSILSLLNKDGLNPKAAKASQTLNIPYTNQQGQKTNTEVTLKFSLKIQQFALIAKRHIPRGSRVSEYHVTNDWIDTSSNGSLHQPLTSLNGIHDLVASRAIRAGTAIFLSDLGSPPIIKKGDKISFTILDGSMTITSEGKALNAASTGGEIKIQSLSSKRILTGKVISSKNIEVRL